MSLTLWLMDEQQTNNSAFHCVRIEIDVIGWTTARNRSNDISTNVYTEQCAVTTIIY